MIVKAGKHFLKLSLTISIIGILIIALVGYLSFGFTKTAIAYYAMALIVMTVIDICIYVPMRKALYDTKRDTIVCWDYTQFNGIRKDSGDGVEYVEFGKRRKISPEYKKEIEEAIKTYNTKSN